MADLFDALSALRPKAQWVYNSQEGEKAPVYSRVVWLDKIQKMPSLADVNAWIAAYVPPPSLTDQIAVLQKQVSALMATQN